MDGDIRKGMFGAMKQERKQKGAARVIFPVLCIALVVLLVLVLLTVKKLHSQPEAQPTPIPTELSAQQSAAVSPALDIPTYAGYAFDSSALSVLSESAFVGDSICSGLYVYGVLPQDMVVAEGNVGIRSLGDYTFSVAGGKYTALQALQTIQPRYVIFSMGMNDINMVSEQVYCEDYLSVLAQTQQLLPSARLYVASITPIDVSSDFASNDKIDRYNAALKDAVGQAGYGYIDVSTHLRDAAGGLDAAFGGGDGIHLNKTAYYSILTDVAAQIIADRR